ncbi:hypothetical protein [Prochlorococcus marinus]|uniref:Uncharacterized protein n=1 Tax=Prochlorococcus marinus str. GP2 TaxID=59925 RepID=A0A0A1ZHM1_PROMR|nr:hypothetical protein [Prochlorococcus marinus]KGF89047.1 hypothetical protein EU91_0161 [Prochlorococcus marinus str. GP2]
MEYIVRQIRFKKFIFILFGLGYLITNNNFAYSETLSSSHINEKDFENSLNLYSVEFHEYENSTNLFDEFFGLEYPYDETSDITNYQDLSIQIDSKNLRDLYKKKIIEMTKSNKTTERKYENEWSFFNKEI